METATAVLELFSSCRGPAWPLVSHAKMQELLEHHLLSAVAGASAVFLKDEQVLMLLDECFPRPPPPALIDFLTFWKGMEELLEALGLQENLDTQDEHIRALQLFRDTTLERAAAKVAAAKAAAAEARVSSSSDSARAAVETQDLRVTADTPLEVAPPSAYSQENFSSLPRIGKGALSPAHVASSLDATSNDAGVSPVVATTTSVVLSREEVLDIVARTIQQLQQRSAAAAVSPLARGSSHNDHSHNTHNGSSGAAVRRQSNDGTDTACVVAIDSGARVKEERSSVCSPRTDMFWREVYEQTEQLQTHITFSLADLSRMVFDFLHTYVQEKSQEAGASNGEEQDEEHCEDDDEENAEEEEKDEERLETEEWEETEEGAGTVGPQKQLTEEEEEHHSDDIREEDRYRGDLKMRHTLRHVITDQEEAHPHTRRTDDEDQQRQEDDVRRDEKEARNSDGPSPRRISTSSHASFTELAAEENAESLGGDNVDHRPQRTRLSGVTQRRRKRGVYRVMNKGAHSRRKIASAVRHATVEKTGVARKRESFRTAANVYVAAASAPAAVATTALGAAAAVARPGLEIVPGRGGETGEVTTSSRSSDSSHTTRKKKSLYSSSDGSSFPGDSVSSEEGFGGNGLRRRSSGGEVRRAGAADRRQPSVADVRLAAGTATATEAPFHERSRGCAGVNQGETKTGDLCHWGPAAASDGIAAADATRGYSARSQQRDEREDRLAAAYPKRRREGVFLRGNVSSAATAERSGSAVPVSGDSFSCVRAEASSKKLQNDTGEESEGEMGELHRTKHQSREATDKRAKANREDNRLFSINDLRMRAGRGFAAETPMTCNSPRKGKADRHSAAPPNVLCHNDTRRRRKVTGSQRTLRETESLWTAGHERAAAAEEMKRRNTAEAALQSAVFQEQPFGRSKSAAAALCGDGAAAGRTEDAATAAEPTTAAAVEGQTSTAAVRVAAVPAAALSPAAVASARLPEALQALSRHEISTTRHHTLKAESEATLPVATTPVVFRRCSNSENSSVFSALHAVECSGNFSPSESPAKRSNREFSLPQFGRGEEETEDKDVESQNVHQSTFTSHPHATTEPGILQSQASGPEEPGSASLAPPEAEERAAQLLMQQRRPYHNDDEAAPDVRVPTYFFQQQPQQQPQPQQQQQPQPQQQQQQQSQQQQLCSGVVVVSSSAPAAASVAFTPRDHERAAVSSETAQEGQQHSSYSSRVSPAVDASGSSSSSCSSVRESSRRFSQSSPVSVEGDSQRGNRSNPRMRSRSVDINSSTRGSDDTTSYRRSSSAGSNYVKGIYSCTSHGRSSNADSAGTYNVAPRRDRRRCSIGTGGSGERHTDGRRKRDETQGAWVSEDGDTREENDAGDGEKDEPWQKAHYAEQQEEQDARRLSEALAALGELCSLAHASSSKRQQQQLLRQQQRLLIVAVESAQRVEAQSQAISEEAEDFRGSLERLRREKEQLLERLRCTEIGGEESAEQQQSVIQTFREEQEDLKRRVAEQQQALKSTELRLREAEEEKRLLQRQTASMESSHARRVEELQRKAVAQEDMYATELQALRREKDTLQQEVQQLHSQLLLTKTTAAAAAHTSAGTSAEQQATRYKQQQLEDANAALSVEVAEKEEQLSRLHTLLLDSRQEAEEQGQKLQQATRLLQQLRAVRDELLRAHDIWTREAERDRHKMLEVMQQAAAQLSSSSTSSGPSSTPHSSTEGYRGSDTSRSAGGRPRRNVGSAAATAAAAAASSADQQLVLLHRQREIERLQTTLQASRNHIKELEVFLDELLEAAGAAAHRKSYRQRQQPTLSREQLPAARGPQHQQSHRRPVAAFNASRRSSLRSSVSPRSHHRLRYTGAVSPQSWRGRDATSLPSRRGYSANSVYDGDSLPSVAREPQPQHGKRHVISLEEEILHTQHTSGASTPVQRKDAPTGGDFVSLSQLLTVATASPQVCVNNTRNAVATAAAASGDAARDTVTTPTAIPPDAPRISGRVTETVHTAALSGGGKSRAATSNSQQLPSAELRDGRRENGVLEGDKTLTKSENVSGELHTVHGISSTSIGATKNGDYPSRVKKTPHGGGVTAAAPTKDVDDEGPTNLETRGRRRHRDTARSDEEGVSEGNDDNTLIGGRSPDKTLKTENSSEQPEQQLPGVDSAAGTIITVDVAGQNMRGYPRVPLSSALAVASNKAPGKEAAAVAVEKAEEIRQRGEAEGEDPTDKVETQADDTNEEQGREEKEREDEDEELLRSGGATGSSNQQYGKAPREAAAEAAAASCTSPASYFSLGLKTSSSAADFVYNGCSNAAAAASLVSSAPALISSAFVSDTGTSTAVVQASSPSLESTTRRNREDTAAAAVTGTPYISPDSYSTAPTSSEERLAEQQSHPRHQRPSLYSALDLQSATKKGRENAEGASEPASAGGIARRRRVVTEDKKGATSELRAASARLTEDDADDAGIEETEERYIGESKKKRKSRPLKEGWDNSVPTETSSSFSSFLVDVSVKSSEEEPDAQSPLSTKRSAASLASRFLSGSSHAVVCKQRMPLDTESRRSNREARRKRRLRVHRPAAERCSLRGHAASDISSGTSRSQRGRDLASSARGESRRWSKHHSKRSPLERSRGVNAAVRAPATLSNRYATRSRETASREGHLSIPSTGSRTFPLSHAASVQEESHETTSRGISRALFSPDSRVLAPLALGVSGGKAEREGGASSRRSRAAAARGALRGSANTSRTSSSEASSSSRREIPDFKTLSTRLSTMTRHSPRASSGVERSVTVSSGTTASHKDPASDNIARRLLRGPATLLHQDSPRRDMTAAEGATVGAEKSAAVRRRLRPPREDSAHTGTPPFTPLSSRETASLASAEQRPVDSLSPRQFVSDTHGPSIASSSRATASQIGHPLPNDSAAASFESSSVASATSLATSRHFLSHADNDHVASAPHSPASSPRSASSFFAASSSPSATSSPLAAAFSTTTSSLSAAAAAASSSFSAPAASSSPTASSDSAAVAVASSPAAASISFPSAASSHSTWSVLPQAHQQSSHRDHLPTQLLPSEKDALFSKRLQRRLDSSRTSSSTASDSVLHLVSWDSATSAASASAGAGATLTDDATAHCMRHAATIEDSAAVTDNTQVPAFETFSDLSASSHSHSALTEETEAISARSTSIRAAEVLHSLSSRVRALRRYPYRRREEKDMGEHQQQQHQRRSDMEEYSEGDEQWQFPPPPPQRHASLADSRASSNSQETSQQQQAHGKPQRRETDLLLQQAEAQQQRLEQQQPQHNEEEREEQQQEQQGQDGGEQQAQWQQWPDEQEDRRSTELQPNHHYDQQMLEEEEEPHSMRSHQVDEHDQQECNVAHSAASGTHRDNLYKDEKVLHHRMSSQQLLLLKKKKHIGNESGIPRFLLQRHSKELSSSYNPTVSRSVRQVSSPEQDQGRRESENQRTTENEWLHQGQSETEEKDGGFNSQLDVEHCVDEIRSRSSTSHSSESDESSSPHSRNTIRGHSSTGSDGSPRMVNDDSSRTRMATKSTRNDGKENNSSRRALERSRNTQAKRSSGSSTSRERDQNSGHKCTPNSRSEEDNMSSGSGSPAKHFSHILRDERIAFGGANDGLERSGENSPPVAVHEQQRDLKRSPLQQHLQLPSQLQQHKRSQHKGKSLRKDGDTPARRILPHHIQEASSANVHQLGSPVLESGGVDSPFSGRHVFSHRSSGKLEAEASTARRWQFLHAAGRQDVQEASFQGNINSKTSATSAALSKNFRTTVPSKSSSSGSFSASSFFSTPSSRDGSRARVQGPEDGTGGQRVVAAAYQDSANAPAGVDAIRPHPPDTTRSSSRNLTYRPGRPRLQQPEAPFFRALSDIPQSILRQRGEPGPVASLSLRERRSTPVEQQENVQTSLVRRRRSRNDQR